MADETGSFATDLAAMANVFIDPSATVKSIDRKLLWLWPIILTGIVATILAVTVAPMSVQLAMQNQAQLQQMSADQMQRAMSIGTLVAKIMAYLAPVWMVVILLILSGLLMAACNVMSMKATFRQLFTLLSVCSLIPMLQVVATYVVIHAKAGQIQSVEELSPPFGLDILLGAGGSKYLVAALHYFSLFQVWYLVVLAIGLAALTKSSKGKAFAAVTPIWLLPLLITLVATIFRQT